MSISTLEMNDNQNSQALICGVDEAGCGPLAGPVVAAAVILDANQPILGLADSKTLSAKKRAVLFDMICERALAFHIASASVAEIDALNIRQATMLAMQRAVMGLSVTPVLVKVDGKCCPKFRVRVQAHNVHSASASSIAIAQDECECLSADSESESITTSITTEAIVRGDALIPSISAASILAKVARDRMLQKLHRRYPEYGFNQHVGYPTPQHLAALKKHGPCIHHRRSFKPVRDAL